MLLFYEDRRSVELDWIGSRQTSWGGRQWRAWSDQTAGNLVGGLSCWSVFLSRDEWADAHYDGRWIVSSGALNNDQQDCNWSWVWCASCRELAIANDIALLQGVPCSCLHEIVAWFAREHWQSRAPGVCMNVYQIDKEHMNTTNVTKYYTQTFLEIFSFYSFTWVPGEKMTFGWFYPWANMIQHSRSRDAWVQDMWMWPCQRWNQQWYETLPKCYVIL